jgi:PAS domain S-box-containing protein
MALPTWEILHLSKRRFFYSLLIILLLIVAIAGGFATYYLGNMARQEIIEESQASALTLSTYVSSTLNRFEGAVKSLAGSPWIAPALLSKGEQDIEHANSTLDRYNSALSVSVSYLIGADGVTVASSNRHDPDSFVGKSYRFRPYFQEAFRGNPYRYFGLGITSGKRGFYASHPVKNRLGKVVGVVTMKKDLDEIEAFFSKYPFCFFISRDGIIFLSSTPAMVLKSLWPLDEAARETLIASQQFGNKHFEAVIKKEIADGAEVTLAGNDYFVSRRVIDRDGWSIVLLTPTDRIRIYKLIGVLATISVGFLILVFSGIIYVIDKSKEAIRQSEALYKTLAEKSMAGVYVVQDRNFRFINSNAASYAGYTKEELLDQEAGLLVSPEDREKVRQNAKAMLLGEMSSPYEFRIITKQLETRWIMETVTSILYEGRRAILGNSMDITERKQADEALRESEQRLQSIIDGSPIPAFVIGKNHRVIHWNKALEETSSIKSDVVVGTCEQWKAFYNEERPCLADLLVDEVVELVPRWYSGKYIKSPLIEDAYEATDFFPALGESGKWLRFTAAAIRDSQGMIVAAVETLEDITERRLAEEALRASEEKYRAIIENMQEGYHEVDLKGNFMFFNESLRKTLGYEREELSGMNYRQYTDEENTRKVYQVYNRVYRTGEPVRNFEYQIIRKDGDRRDIEISISLIRDADNHPTGFRGVVRDTTDRKLAEKKLSESEEQYRLLVENANEMIFIAQDGVIKFPNRKTIDTMGYTAEELARIPFTQHIHPKDLDMVVEQHKKRLQGGSPQRIYSFRVLNRSKEELWFEVNAVRIDWEGRPATLNFMRDVTEQKRLEAQLLHAQKMEAIGTLAGGLAHDFNNLLTGILGNASLAKTGMDSSDQSYVRLQNIETIVESAAGLTRQLLAFSRRGRIDVRASDINEIIDKTAVMFSRTNKNVTIQRNLHKDLWPAEVDRGQMEQVFLNLFVNAWQAMPGGGNLYLDSDNIVLTRTDLKHPYMKPGRYVKVSVTDTGTGMDEKTQARIFEPFFTTKEMGRGTGLGLSMVYGIIKGHNGFINVYSEPDHGTTFNVYLPASEKKIPSEAPALQNVLRGTEAILIVDDEQMNLKVSKEILESLGYTVYTASSGNEALALYNGKTGAIDLVILDVIMPVMSCGETYGRMKEINPDVRVILCSGYSIDGDARKIMDRGCNGFIQKPFNLPNLSQKIREVLDKKA